MDWGEGEEEEEEGDIGKEEERRRKEGDAKKRKRKKGQERTEENQARIFWILYFHDRKYLFTTSPLLISILPVGLEPTTYGS